ncbi:hypothetical protein BLOT_000793 [Blomia tropicalis]|nr:hypothetical protein BLOT_000793 [Blomia tropicalis]
MIAYLRIQIVLIKQYNITNKQDGYLCLYYCNVCRDITAQVDYIQCYQYKQNKTEQNGQNSLWSSG